MTDTPKLALPLLDGAQAQKHVTVNEALARIDALLGGGVKSRTADVPGAPADGDVHVVPAGPTGAWAGEDGRIALFLNGGWEFVTAPEGLSLWVEDEAVRVTRDGGWTAGLAGHGSGGAATLQEVIVIDHAVGAGASSTVTGAIPDKAAVIGVTARVTGAITGAASWSLGVAGSTDRYGSGYGVGLNAFAEGLTGAPVTYYGDTDLVLTAGGADFGGTGTVRIAVHCLRLRAPASV